MLDSHFGPLFSQMNYPGPPGRAPDQSYTKLRSRQPINRRQRIVPHTWTTPKTAQVHPAFRDTFQTYGNVKNVASSIDSIVSGQVGVAGTKSINIIPAPSTQLQGNPIHEPKVGKKGGRTLV
ncbi:MAG: hypothetical protein EZS28_015033 [Streblomastix strix]|uniref:Uncharacterized protein n=1 Tax=Streblomastix strix TaxID=222440 RepID=A0A5J4W4I7_9EUKA|nr:MAG: hypothetical protein EZS28_015033 [Streblomastix strix]